MLCSHALVLPLEEWLQHFRTILWVKHQLLKLKPITRFATPEAIENAGIPHDVQGIHIVLFALMWLVTQRKEVQFDFVTIQSISDIVLIKIACDVMLRNRKELRGTVWRIAILRLSFSFYMIFSWARRRFSALFEVFFWSPWRGDAFDLIWEVVVLYLLFVPSLTSATWHLLFTLVLFY